MKDFTCRYPAHASDIFAVIDLDDLLIWSVNEYFSSFGE